jgi:superfamily I DNA/RNA helicase
VDCAGIKIEDEISYYYQVKSGDMLLCRVNAPLVSECFKFIKLGKKANIQGRDVGQGLISTINKMDANDLGDLQMKLSDWLHREVTKENNKRNPSDSRIITLQDRYDCINCFMEDQTTIEQVINSIKELFTDDKDCPGIMLSSIHKAKGLEAKRVFLLEPEGATVPHPMAKTEWQQEQEMNLRYVAITRAIEELVYVS